MDTGSSHRENIEQADFALTQTVTGTENWSYGMPCGFDIGVGILSVSPTNKANRPKMTSASRCGTKTATSLLPSSEYLGSLSMVGISFGIRLMVNTAAWHRTTRRSIGDGDMGILRSPGSRVLPLRIQQTVA